MMADQPTENPYQSPAPAAPPVNRGRSTGAKICLVLGVLFLFSAINVVRKMPTLGPNDMGQVVGAFIIPVALIIAALKLNQKPPEGN